MSAVAILEIIAILLGIIAAVLLFGREPVLAGLAIIAGLWAIVGLIWIAARLARGAKRAFELYRADLRQHIKDRGILATVLWTALQATIGLWALWCLYALALALTERPLP